MSIIMVKLTSGHKPMVAKSNGDKRERNFRPAGVRFHAIAAITMAMAPATITAACDPMAKPITDPAIAPPAP